MRWEYRELAFNNYDISFNYTANELGRDGWELVSVVVTIAGSYMAFFKRIAIDLD
jgi:hypothetical protein